MDINEIILDYLHDINPSVINRIENSRNISIARVFDSLSMIAFLSFLERTFSITINDTDVLSKNFETMGSVVNFVMEKQKPNRSVEK